MGNGDGPQVPGGTVEPGADPARACARELWEEAGLAPPAPPRLSGIFFYVHAGKGEHQRGHICAVRGPDGLPAEWTHVVTGRGRDRGRRLRCRWLDLRRAAAELAAAQGLYVHRAAMRLDP